MAGTIDLQMDLTTLYAFFRKISQAITETKAHEVIYQNLLAHPTIFNDARQFLGLSDKRAYLDLSYIASRTPHPTEQVSLSGCHPWTLSRHPMAFFLRMLSGSKGKAVQLSTAQMITDYLIKQGLYDAAKGFSSASDQLLRLIYTRLIIPKEYQQKAAKRRGHGCEAALAFILEQCGAELLPKNKSTNPMGAPDPHINLSSMTVTNRLAGTTHAFDMVVLNDGRHIAVAIQSLIHTSDPGQYGVDKSNETVLVADLIKQWSNNHPYASHVELWGLVDGVGFSENKPDTINKMLRNFVYFMQLRTLYKAPLRLHKLGLARMKAIGFSPHYDSEDIESIVGLYVPNDVQVVGLRDQPDKSWQALPAGEATVYL